MRISIAARRPTMPRTATATWKPKVGSTRNIQRGRGRQIWIPTAEASAARDPTEGNRLSAISPRHPICRRRELLGLSHRQAGHLCRSQRRRVCRVVSRSTMTTSSATWRRNGHVCCSGFEPRRSRWNIAHRYRRAARAWFRRGYFLVLRNRARRHDRAAGFSECRCGAANHPAAAGIDDRAVAC